MRKAAYRLLKANAQLQVSGQQHFFCGSGNCRPFLSPHKVAGRQRRDQLVGCAKST